MAEYSTISEDLVEYADQAIAKARADGYRIEVEKAGPYFPVTPTLRGKAAHRELIIEVAAKCSFKEAKKWIAYGKAQGHETKVVLVVPPQRKNISVEEIASFQAAGLGLWVGSSNGLVSLTSPRDLSSEVVCPDISGDPGRVKKKLKPGFDKIRGGEVIDGFKDVAIVVETLARRRLLDGVRSGRITFASPNGSPIVHPVSAIKRGTMGWLRDRYSEMVTPNATDNIIFLAFDAVCADRNLVSHNDLTPAQKRAISGRIGKHLLVLRRAAKSMLS